MLEWFEIPPLPSFRTTYTPYFQKVEIFYTDGSQTTRQLKINCFFLFTKVKKLSIIILTLNEYLIYINVKTLEEDKIMAKNDELTAQVAELENMLVCLEERLSQVKPIKVSRKVEVMNILKDNGHISVADIAILVGITERNISSQLTYLRRDGINIGTDSKGRKFIES